MSVLKFLLMILLAGSVAERVFNDIKCILFCYFYNLVLQWKLFSVVARRKHAALSWCASQPAFTCSKLTIEILEQGVKYVQS